MKHGLCLRCCEWASWTVSAVQLHNSPRLRLPEDHVIPTVAMDEKIDLDDIIANCVMSLRFLENCDWKDFFEQVNPTEHILRSDPLNAYASMDFDTRDRYRKVVEALAASSQRSETEVAGAAIRLARSKDAQKDQEPQREKPRWILSHRCGAEAAGGFSLVPLALVDSPPPPTYESSGTDISGRYRNSFGSSRVYTADARQEWRSGPCSDVFYLPAGLCSDSGNCRRFSELGFHPPSRSAYSAENGF